MAELFSLLDNTSKLPSSAEVLALAVAIDKETDIGFEEKYLRRAKRVWDV
jgi:hypothetical protein